MFEELIAQGRDMIRRLEGEWRLPQGDRELLPAYQRVPVREAVAWQEAVEEKLRASFGPDTLRRYEGVGAMYSDELNRGQGDEYSRSLNSWNRIVALLEELDARAARPSAPPPAASHGAAPAPGAGAFVQTYDVFISHAWEDKEAVARPLAAALAERGVEVWFDENTLELGDSLRRKIDQGLARSRYGIVILSPRFLEKEWPQRELDGLVARETASGEKALLPIWHELDAATLMRYSPPLADRLGARSDEGIPALVDKILRVLRK